MKFTTIATTAAISGLATALPTKLAARYSTVQGFDVSNYQPNVDFSAAKSAGAEFVIIKATEGTDYKDTYFNSHYTGATNAGLIRGGYHFARPDKSSGTAQAEYFLAHGGGWSKDGRTLPGMLDIEYNPYGATCYGLSHSAMVSWVNEFLNEYHSKTGVYPLLYTTADWWNQCTGNAHGFGNKSPLVLASYSSESPRTVPGDWQTWTIWQNADKYKYGGDSDIFNGDLTQLKKIVEG
uniref:Lysozyme n=1 Tax=Aspergillus sp. TaxID=5065 RepID=A0A7S6G7I4_9EURO|nr:GH25 muramidase [Aspergillus sp.]